jgi:glycosyltransferase involved in cell wall biosynthesis
MSERDAAVLEAEYAVDSNTRIATQASRILYIEANEDGTVGGSHRALFDLVRNIDREAFEPVVLFYQNNAYVELLKSAGFEVHVFEEIRARERRIRASGNRLQKLIDFVGAVARRVGFLRRHRVDLVHINNSPRAGNDDWLPAARILGIPSIANVMGDAGGPAGSWLSRRQFRAFQHYLPISRYIAESMVRAGIPEHQMTLVYLGVDIEDIRARVKRPRALVRSELGVDTDMFLVVMVGNVREWKGQHVVLEALAQIPPTVRRQLRVAFAGAVSEFDIDYFKGLGKFVAEHQLNESVTFLGGRSDVPDLLHAADLALHASVKPEPFGLVVVEAMALGKPVIGAATGGPAEVITESSGVVFDPGNPARLASELIRLINDPALRSSLARGAEKRARDFTVQRYVDGVVRVYKRLLASEAQTR